MDIIATWIYLDSKSEESNFPQTRGKSSEKQFQQVYWECVVVFFSSSLRFNKGKKHLLFTNAKQLPVIGSFNVRDFLHENNIEIVQIDNEFRLPKGYFGSWNNQFYEFSILNYLSRNVNTDFRLLLLDSDCIFNTSVDYLFRELEASHSPAFTYYIDYAEEYDINGLTRIQMQQIFNELGLACNTAPKYSGGEVLFAKSDFINKVCSDFQNLWSELLNRFERKKIKFNEEAHVLSYYYYKYMAEQGKLNDKIKRCWTNPLSYRNVVAEDKKLDILHFPAEKGKGIRDIYNLISGKRTYLYDLSGQEYKKMIARLLSPQKYYFSIRSWGPFLLKNIKKTFRQHT